MYCLDALEKCAKMARAQAQRIAFEIAAIGQRRLDTNDPAPKYRLKSLAEDFSGLHWVCLMHVGCKSIAPDQDIDSTFPRNTPPHKRSTKRTPCIKRFIGNAADLYFPGFLFRVIA
jgi:hypothetical protein